MADFMQFLTAGVTVGAVYALVALGFTIIYNASDVVNFAQGEFVMLGGMTTFFLSKAGLPLPLAAIFAILITTLIGLVVYGAAMEKPAAAGLLAFFPVAIGLWSLALPVALAVAAAIVAAIAAARRSFVFIGSLTGWVADVEARVLPLISRGPYRAGPPIAVTARTPRIRTDARLRDYRF